MVSRGDPAPLRWLIGVELARYRNLAKLSLTEASAHTGMGKAKLGHMETGRQQQTPDDIAELLAGYGAEQRDIDRLTSLTGRADEATWWAPWAQVVPDWLKTFVGLEGLAESEFVFEPIGIRACCRPRSVPDLHQRAPAQGHHLPQPVERTDPAGQLPCGGCGRGSHAPVRERSTARSVTGAGTTRPHKSRRLRESSPVVGWSK